MGWPEPPNPQITPTGWAQRAEENPVETTAKPMDTEEQVSHVPPPLLWRLLHPEPATEVFQGSVAPLVCGVAYAALEMRAVMDLLLACGLSAPLVFAAGGPTLRLQRRLVLFWVIYGGSTAMIAYCAFSGSGAWLPGRWPHLSVLTYGVFAMATALAWYHMDDEDIGD